MSSLKCSVADCKKRLLSAKEMNLQELEKYTTRCASCGEWIFKNEDVANKTYNEVSNRWAEEFMNNIIRKK